MALFRTAARSDEFCPPELVESDGATIAGDVWSYGIVLCYLYNGESPYATALTAMAQGVLDPHVSLRNHIGARLCAPVNPVRTDGVGSQGNASLSHINFAAGDETDEMLKGLIDMCLKPNPSRRCTFQQIIGHPFFLF
jgi:serine/threonine protein kinase